MHPCPSAGTGHAPNMPRVALATSTGPFTRVPLSPPKRSGLFCKSGKAQHFMNNGWRI